MSLTWLSMVPDVCLCDCFIIIIIIIFIIIIILNFFICYVCYLSLVCFVVWLWTGHFNCVHASLSECVSVRLSVCLSLSVFLPAMLCCLDWRINVRICVLCSCWTHKPTATWQVWCRRWSTESVLRYDRCKEVTGVMPHGTDSPLYLMVGL